MILQDITPEGDGHEPDIHAEASTEQARNRRAEISGFPRQAAETDTHADVPTANPFGLTEPEDETIEATRQSDGVDQPKRMTPMRERQSS